MTNHVVISLRSDSNGTAPLPPVVKTQEILQKPQDRKKRKVPRNLKPESLNPWDLVEPLESHFSLKEKEGYKAPRICFL